MRLFVLLCCLSIVPPTWCQTQTVQTGTGGLTSGTLTLAKPSQARIAVRDAIVDMTWESEGSDDLQAFFLSAQPEFITEDGIKVSLTAWAKTRRKSERPHGLNTVGVREISDLLKSLLVPEPIADGTIDPADELSRQQWAQLYDLMMTKTKGPKVYEIGDDDSFKIIVIAGTDEEGNLVGVWMSDWSS